jgi:hypothetical protein
MFDWLIKITGPQFLIFFSVVSILGIAVGWWLVRGSGGGYSLPDKNRLEPIPFAVLRGLFVYPDVRGGSACLAYRVYGKHFMAEGAGIRGQRNKKLQVI